MIDNTHTLDILHFIQLLKFVTLSQNGYNNGRTNIIMASDTICVACGHLRATHTTGIGDPLTKVALCLSVNVGNLKNERECQL